MTSKIFYNNYLRCEVRHCHKCRIDRPLKDWFKNGLGIRDECKACSKQIRDAWKRSHPDHAAARDARYRANNREKLRLAALRYRKENGDILRYKDKLRRLEQFDILGDAHPALHKDSLYSLRKRFSRSLRLQGFKASMKDIRFIMEQSRFKYIMKKWRKAGLPILLAPSLKVKFDSDLGFEVMTVYERKYGKKPIIEHSASHNELRSESIGR